MLSDIVIAQNAKVLPIKQIADKLYIDEDYLEYYGKDKAKIDLNIFKSLENNKNGKFSTIWKSGIFFTIR